MIKQDSESMEKQGLTTSSFTDNNEHPSVFVAGGNSAYENTVNALSSIDLSSAKNKKVLLKPNAGRIASPGQGITTNPQVVAAAIDVFKKAGAIVSVGESPITGVKALEALESSGITKVAEERNVHLIDMDARKYIKVSIPHGEAIKSIKVCPEVLESDIVVSIPVMKIHMHTGVTLSVKNMKGCLWRRSKVDLHMLPEVKDSSDKSLDIAIADMSSVLRPHLSIIDGSIGMEGMGPSAGKPIKVGVVVVSADAFAADAVACKLMGCAVNGVPHLRIGAKRGYGTTDTNNMNIVPDNWQSFAVKFEAPPDNPSIEFPNVNILDKQSCSACQSTLLLFLQRHGQELKEYLPKDDVLNIAIGKGHDHLQQGTLCIGNCTSCHRSDNIFVPGCPPVASQILKMLEKSKTKLS